MSEIITDKLTGKTSAGDVDVTSEGGAVTMQLQQGLVKSWINFNGTGTIAVRDSFNISGIVDEGTGFYTNNFTNSMGNTNYCLADGSVSGGTTRGTFLKDGSSATSYLASSFSGVLAVSDNSTDGQTGSDITFVNRMFMGDLA